MKVSVINYGIGNVFSVCSALKTVGADVSLTGNLDEILAADRVILPGVGAFGRASDAIFKSGMADTIARYIETGRPMLGICVGMQLLFSKGLEFGEFGGLDYIKGTVEKIEALDSRNQPLKVPFIGWSTLHPAGEQSWAGTSLENTRQGHDSVYFVHSYCGQSEDEADVLATTNYGQKKIVAAVRRDNVTGFQFHPERSGRAGLSILQTFLEQQGS